MQSRPDSSREDLLALIQLKGFIGDGKTRTHVNLDGIDFPIPYARSGAGVDPTDVAGCGFTRWEMNQLSNSPDAWNRVTQYRGGREGLFNSRISRFGRVGDW